MTDEQAERLIMAVQDVAENLRLLQRDFEDVMGADSRGGYALRVK